MKDKKEKQKKDFLIMLVDDKASYSHIEKKLGYEKGVAKVKVNRFKREGLIIKRGEHYEFTDKGNKLFRGLERVLTEEGQVNIHFHKIKAKILEKRLFRQGSTFIEKVEKLIQIPSIREQVSDIDMSKLKNHNIIIFKGFHGTQIRATTEHILIGIPKMIYDSLDACLRYSEDYFKEILPKVEKFFDIKLDNHFVNEYWVSSRHIAYVNHKLGLLHKKYKCMDIEIKDDVTGQRLLYFDGSNGQTDTETASTRKGVDIAYNLEQFDRDIVEGHSLSGNQKAIESVKVSTDITMKDLRTFLSEMNVSQDKSLGMVNNALGRLTELEVNNAKQIEIMIKSIQVLTRAMELQYPQQQIQEQPPQPESRKDNQYIG